MATVTYSKRVFDVPNEAEARRIILTPEFDEDTDTRWNRETPYLLDLIGEQLKPARGSLYVDYGCGIGRIAKGMIERFGCRVLGVDISYRMRALAPEHVQAHEFSVVSPHLFHTMVASGLRVAGGISIWVLQHCADPAVDIGLIRNSIAPGGLLHVVNEKGRAVPTVEGRWANDGKDVRALLASEMDELATGRLDDAFVPSGTCDRTFWATYQR